MIMRGGCTPSAISGVLSAMKRRPSTSNSPDAAAHQGVGHLKRDDTVHYQPISGR
jgi:hypothetical protein